MPGILKPRWSRDQASAWHARQPWIVGCNFLPSYAVNFVDMWHVDSFDPAVIDRELGWGASIGMNAVRVNLQCLQWIADPAGQTGIFATFLDMTARHDMRVVPCLFDDCGFSGDPASAGPQPDPRPGVHNGRALASPGREIVTDSARWPECLAFLRDVMTTFGDHPNILFWDLYNEPGNGTVFPGPAETADISPTLRGPSLAFLHRVFEAAMEIDPVHPLTAGAWRHRNAGDRHAGDRHAGDNHVGDDTGTGQHPYRNEIDQVMLRLSDVVSYHAYVDVPRMRALIGYLESFGRPLYCTEWMARHAGSRIADQLAVLRQHNIGAFQWGLVRGRSQTHLPWPDINARLEKRPAADAAWFHDLLHPDGSPHDRAEIDTIRALAAKG